MTLPPQSLDRNSLDSLHIYMNICFSSQDKFLICQNLTFWVHILLFLRYKPGAE